MKNILILSGVHGNELSAVLVGMDLKRYYNYDGMVNKTIKVIPWCNPSGLFTNKREMQDTSTKDLNRSFSNVESSSNYIDNLKKEIEWADIVIDIHNSECCAHFCLLDIGCKNNIEIQNACIEADVEYAMRYSNGGTIKDYVNELGKIGITYEFTGMSAYNNNDNIDRAYNEIKKLINVFKSEDDFANSIKDNRLKELYSTKSGFIHYRCKVNEIISPNELLFFVLDDRSEIIETVKNDTGLPIKIMALESNFQKKGSSVLMYITKE